MSDGTRVRLARGEDAPAVRSLVAELGYVIGTGDDSIGHVLASDAHRLWIAELGADPVGYALAHVHLRLGLGLGEPMVSLDELVVTRAARGRGVGTALLAAARAWAAETGAARIELITSRSLESYRSRFYEKRGFREIDSAVLRAPTPIETTSR